MPTSIFFLRTISSRSSSREALRAGCRWSAPATAFMMKGRMVIRTPSRSPVSRIFARSARRPETSASSTSKAWGTRVLAATIFRAIIRRFPLKGIRSSDVDSAGVPAGAFGPAARRTSSSVIRPPGPLPGTAPRSTPRSFASFRTTGVARTSPPGAAVFDSRGLDEGEEFPHLHDLAGRCEDRHHGPVSPARGSPCSPCRSGSRPAGRPP